LAEERIFRTFDVINETLVSFGVDERRIPDCAVYYILKMEYESYDKVKQILAGPSQTDLGD